MQRPLLPIVTVSSAKEPTHASPKLPESAIIKVSLGARSTPETATMCRPVRSSLLRVIAADLGRTWLA
ncbi:MAG TPA: hypothetical protein VH639_28525 [Bryobacteraceae bacterium]